MSEQKYDGGPAIVSELPSFNGDGYGYGGGYILSINGLAFNLGTSYLSREIAHKLAKLWNDDLTAERSKPERTDIFEGKSISTLTLDECEAALEHLGANGGDTSDDWEENDRTYNLFYQIYVRKEYLKMNVSIMQKVQSHE